MSLINDALKRASAQNNQEPKKQLPFIQPVEKPRHIRAASVYIAISTVFLLVSLCLTGLWIMDRFFNKEKTAKIATAKTTVKLTEPVQPANKEKNVAATVVNEDKKPVAATTTATNNIAMNFGDVKKNETENRVQIDGQTQTMNEVKMPENTAAADLKMSNSQSNVSLQELKNETATAVKQSEEQIKVKPETIVSNVTRAAESSSKAQPVSEMQFPQLKLNGIFYRVNNPSAIINGKLIKVGDVIDGAKIISIDKNSVTVEFSNQTRVLRM
ncbi:MAG: hypothetical protein ACP5T0_12775 [Verrucomicrobiia bacterium]